MLPCVEATGSFILNMTNKLETICIEKVKVMRMAYVNKEAERCKSVCSGFNEDCEFYKPVSRTDLPFRQGAYAYELQRK
jgi:hypothetical protein